jgi:DNA-binding transcriptional LysR family regulator
MNLRRLKYFLMVAEEENLHRASARLHVAQPALTRQIRLLEEELGTTLFNRLPRGISLSTAGHAFLEDARQILRLTEQAHRRAHAVASGQMGTLRVGFHDAAHFYPVLRDLFTSFRSEFANVHFRFVSSSSDQQLESLLAKDLDAGFIYRWDQPPGDFEYLPLARDELGLALSENHKLAQKSVVTIEDLRNEPFVWGDTVAFHGHTEAIMRACAAIGFIPKVWHEGLSSLSAMISLVAAGLGLAIIPKQIITVSPAIVMRPVEGLNRPVDLLLAWRGDNSSPALANFVRHARTHITPAIGQGGGGNALNAQTTIHHHRVANDK